MNKREKRKQIEEMLRHRMKVHVWQDKPYTAVKVVVVYEGLRDWAYGFSKVCHPDEWDGKYGIELAVDKAIAKMAKAMVADPPIEVLGLGVRVSNALKRAGILSVPAVLERLQEGDRKMLRIRHFGEDSLAKLKAALQEYEGGSQDG